MNKSRTLGSVMLAPALIFVLLFFVLPVVLTGVFSFTNMSTATGIGGGSYQVTPSAIQQLSFDYEMPALARELGETRFSIDQAGLDQLKSDGVDTRFIEQIENNLLGQQYQQRRDLSRALRSLQYVPRSTRERNTIADTFQRSVDPSRRFQSEQELLDAINLAGIELTPGQQDAVAKVTYTGWVWTTENYRRITTLPDNRKALTNTIIYVLSTLTLFNIGFALILALTTHYMPKSTAGVFRAIWMLPRITPPVLYVLLWKWLAWDTGFLSSFLGMLDIPSRNWMLDSPTNAWIFVILINGFVGASMGMLVLSSAINAIPKSHFWASEVDGATRLQQIRYIILPQLRWPILFMTCYQTLSLLASFDYILLATGGGPGGATEVWSLKAYNTALSNYTGNLQYGYGAALALVLVGIGLVMSIVYLKLFGFNKMMAKPRIEV